MKFTQAIKMAISSILSNKMRSLLTMLGIIIGILSVVILIAIGQGLNSPYQVRLKVLEQILLQLVSQATEINPFLMLILRN